MSRLHHAAAIVLYACAAGGVSAQTPAQAPDKLKVQLPVQLDPGTLQLPQLPAIPAPLINQNSLFSAPIVRDQLRLTEQQFNQLNSAWNDAWKQYDTAARKLGDLAQEQRAKAMSELSNTFNRNFAQASAGVLNPQQQSQFHQLTTQLSGLSLLGDQNLSGKLNLNEEQQTKLQKAAGEFNARMAKLDWSNPQRAITAYHAMLPDLRKAMNQVLTDEQRAVWNLVYGQSFNFANVEANPNR